jgi:hypothetical protein
MRVWCGIDWSERHHDIAALEWAPAREDRSEIWVKAMEGVRDLGDAGAEGLPGVWGAERSDSDGGNWRGPPRPGNLRHRVAGAAGSITGHTGK